jgi:cyclophilin family peptidyl-prolyl cis-trans isomerase/HEAT repeat protein
MTLGRDTPPPPEGDDRGRIRALAASALGRTRRLSLDLIEGAQGDPEPEVRRAVLPFLNAVPPRARARLVARALSDTSARVAIEAVRHLAASPRTAERCDHLIAAAAPDSDPAVRITALEALASGCPNYSAQRAALVAIASALGERDGSWQPPARALLSLATIDPGGAAGLLGPFAEHENAFVRAWAARAAARIPDTETLFTLTLDPSPNVSTEAIQGLFAIEEHDIDGALLQQLEGNDPQLLMTVAGLLEGAPDRQTVSRSLVSSFERISAAERETWRDPRLALLERIAELGDPPLAARLSPFLQDYDPLVAERVGTILASWTGREQQVEPQPLPRAPVPTLAEVRALDGATLTLHRSGGGSLVIELLAEQAPTNVARLVRLAEAGYYDGLTFHRWEANFVIQGGSPSAHEYQGDGPYTRDEVGGLPHFRGTVGLSTRGRDTGDGQIFVNLVDNPRLDHDYTVVGRLVDGYDVLDDILEGDVIERAVVARAR